MIRQGFWFWANVLVSVAALIVGVFSERAADAMWEWCVIAEEREYRR